MSEELISSLYPPPPPFYEYFTRENLDKLAAWQNEHDENGKNTGIMGDSEMEIDKETDKNIDNAIKGGTTKHESSETTNSDSSEAKLTTNHDSSETTNHGSKGPPGELKFLIPPEQPQGTHYRGYGNLWSFEDKLPSLKDSGWKQLYQEEDELITSKTKIEELHKLMDSLLLNFLELIGCVSIDPSKFHYKIEDLKLVLININHILNTYRPHQTRESLIMLLRKQIDKKNAEIDEIDQVSTKIKNRIRSLAGEASSDHTGVSNSSPNNGVADIKTDTLIKLLAQETT